MPSQWRKWNFSLHYHHFFKQSSDKNKESDHQGGDVLIFRQILGTCSIRNLWRTVKRMCIFISGLKGLRQHPLAFQLPELLCWGNIWEMTYSDNHMPMMILSILLLILLWETNCFASQHWANLVVLFSVLKFISQHSEPTLELCFLWWKPNKSTGTTLPSPDRMPILAMPPNFYLLF